MNGQPVVPVHSAPPGRLERAWRWTAYAVLPFAAAFAVALSLTAYLQARGPASTGTSVP